MNKPSESDENKWYIEYQLLCNKNFKGLNTSEYWTCYLQACRARQSEIESLKAEVDKANREVFSMVEIHKSNREEIESLKAELEKWKKYEGH